MPSSSGRKSIVGRHESMADMTLEFVDFGRGIAWLLVPDMGSGRNMVRALAERVAMTETGLIMSTYPIQIVSAPRRTDANASITCPSTVTYFPTGIIFGNEAGKGWRPENACRNLSFIIMGDIIPLPVVPLPLPGDWKPEPSQGNSISRE